MPNIKLPCPSCAQALNLPEKFAGKSVKCPACQKEFIAPGTPAETAPLPVALPGAPVDELALQEMDHKPDGGPPDPTALEVCPGCGAKWKIGAKECKKCHYNAIVGAKLRPPLKSRHGILSNFDIQKMFLYAAIAAIAFGIYWLVTNFDSLKRKGNDWYDNASRSRPTETDDTVMIRKDAPKVEKD